VPVNSQHPAYKHRIGQWKRCRDVSEGSDAVKEAGEDYLARPKGQERSEYEAYKSRAMFYDALGRTIEGLVGSVARKEPKLEAPEILSYIEDDITGTGVGLLEFVKTIITELLTTDRIGMMVDLDKATKRPFLTIYRAEQIINWFDDGGVVLEEVVAEADPSDPFKIEMVTQWRHLGLFDGVYGIEVWRKRSTAKGEELYIYDKRTPDFREQPFTKIPFKFLSRKGADPTAERPPLIGLADVVLSHYRTSADLEHGRHFTALPTLFISGMNNQESDIHIGGSSAIILNDPQAKVGYAEFSGAGLASLEKGIEQKEEEMATLGAALFSKRGGVETAEAARIRSSGESSLLSSIVTATEEVLEACLEMMCKWLGSDGTIDLHINRDFVGERITAQEILALLQAYTAGAMSLESFLHNLQTGEMLPPDLDIEAQAVELKAQAQQAADKAQAAAVQMQKSQSAMNQKM
jgi:hypothetical protein